MIVFYPEFQIYLPHLQIIKKKFAVLFKNQNDHDQFDFQKFLLFMNKMFVLYFALLQSGRGTTKKIEYI
jgi:hypothetical protein